MTNAQRLLLGAMLVAALVPMSTSAQQPPANEPPPLSKEQLSAVTAKTDTSANASLDLAVPESPAFAVLDLTPQSVVRPTSPRELATALLNGVDRNGHFQTGIALEVDPYLLYARDLELSTYRQGRFNIQRLIARSQISLATTKGASSDDKSVRLSLGASITPVDYGDPRLDTELLDCIDRAQVAALQATHRIRMRWLIELPNDQREEAEAALGFKQGQNMASLLTKLGPEEIEKRLHGVSLEIIQKYLAMVEVQRTLLDRQVEKCRKEARERNWNATSWELGGAPRWTSDTGNVNDVQFRGGALWTSLALGSNGKTAPARSDDGGLAWLRSSTQLILHVRYRFDSDVPDPDDSGNFLHQDDLLVGGRLRFGTPRFGISVEGAFTHANRDKGKDEQTGRYSAAVDLKLAKDWWIELSAGGESGGGDNAGQGFVLSSIKFGFPSEPSVNVPGLQ